MISGSTGVVGVKRLAQEHLRGGNEGGASSYFHQIKGLILENRRKKGVAYVSIILPYLPKQSSLSLP